MRDFIKYKRRFVDYLVLKGIKIDSNMIRCFSPNHEDRNPSCQISEIDFCCYSCGIKGDIYDAVGIIEGITDKTAQYDFVEKFFKEAGNA